MFLERNANQKIKKINYNSTTIRKIKKIPIFYSKNHFNLSHFGRVLTRILNDPKNSICFRPKQFTKLIFFFYNIYQNYNSICNDDELFTRFVEEQQSVVVEFDVLVTEILGLLNRVKNPSDRIQVRESVSFSRSKRA